MGSARRSGQGTGVLSSRAAAARRDRAPLSLLDSGDLPVEDLARIAMREAQRPRQIYQAHKWFARRFGSAFRALLTAATVHDQGAFWPTYYEGADLRGRTVFDPFVGGGTSVVEAQRLGADVLGVDVDEVACAITGFELRAAAVPDLRPALAQLSERVGGELARYYRTLDAEGRERTVLHFFYVQVVTCGDCGTDLEAHPHYQLAHEADGSRQWAFCKDCHAIQEIPKRRRRLDCRQCGTRTSIKHGPVTYGCLQCPSCGGKERLIEHARRTGRIPSWRLFALEVLGPEWRGGPAPLRERHFLTATEVDRALAEAAAQAFDGRGRDDGKLPWVPDRLVPSAGRSDDRLPSYGYRRYSDMFLPRQLLHLSRLAQAIDRLEAPVREAFCLAFSDHLATNCVMAAYAFGWRRLVPLFSLRAYRHVSRPVEINPWLEGVGRGTFPNAVRQVERAISDAKAPKEALLDGGFRPSIAQREPNHQSSSRILHASSQAQLPIQSSSVDIVLTDPPYFDNIAYAELSDFFFPWLQQFGLVHGDNAERLAFEHGLTADRHDADTAVGFSESLGRCFAQVARVLKPEGRMVFTYRHHTAAAWQAIGNALAASGLRPMQVFPMLGEGPGSLHDHTGTALWDAVIVASRVPGTGAAGRLALTRAQQAAASTHVERWARRLRRHFRAADTVNLYRAALVCAALNCSGVQKRESAPSTLRKRSCSPFHQPPKSAMASQP
jgi:adenine-specific DNA methylase